MLRRLCLIFGYLIFQHAAVAAVWNVNLPKLIASARSQVGVTLSYDPQYRALAYPNGDVPMETGVCTDVLIRALRTQGIDLQKDVHEDMKANFDKYPRQWGLKKTDTNIDHRRVPNLMTFFKRRGFEQSKSTVASNYQPGDFVAWDLGGGITHIGIVSDRQFSNGTPLIIHNIGSGAKEEDILFGYRIIGHYRIRMME